jgi:hypothetical protein
MPQTTTSPVEAAYMKAVLADKPMGYWPLNESAGARKILDRSGNAIDGFAMSKVTAGQPGPFGDGSRALALDGKGYIDLGRHDQFAMPNNFTVEAWAWIIGEEATRNTGYVVSALGGEGAKCIGWGLVAGRDANEHRNDPIPLYFIVQPGFHHYYPLSKTETIDNRWLHVAVAFDDANTVHLYLNGVCRGEFKVMKQSQVGPVWLQIGCSDPATDMWPGRLAHVAVYPRVLSAQQIENHYRRGTENTTGTE